MLIRNKTANETLCPFSFFLMVVYAVEARAYRKHQMILRIDIVINIYEASFDTRNGGSNEAYIKFNHIIIRTEKRPV